MARVIVRTVEAEASAVLFSRNLQKGWIAAQQLAVVDQGPALDERNRTIHKRRCGV